MHLLYNIWRIRCLCVKCMPPGNYLKGEMSLVLFELKEKMICHVSFQKNFIKVNVQNWVY